MRGLIATALLLTTSLSALAQTPVFTSIQAGNLALNVKGAPYNAKCDGTTDDTAAIQSAISAGVSSGQAFTLLLPAGVCKTTATLTITGASAQNIAIKGESRATSQLLVTGTADGIDINMAPVTGQVYAGMLDVSDFTMLATGTAGTAIKAISSAPNSVSPKFTNLRIGFLSGGSFANGISTANMSNLVVHNVNINSPNATGIAFQFDGNATFPSITDNFSDIYFFNFATSIQIGNGTTSYVQGVEITNAQLQPSNKACIVWNNNPVGFLADQLLVGNSFCNGTIAINNVEDIVLHGNYILSSPGGGQITITGATSGIISNNAFNGQNSANTNGIDSVASHLLITGNNFINYTAAGSAPIVFSSGTDSLAIGNKCDACGTDAVVNDFGTNMQRDNINNGNLGSTVSNIVTKHTAQETWYWQTPATPSLLLAGTAMGWNYQGQGEADVFLSRGAGGAHGDSMVWYDTTAGSVGTQLMGLSIDGNVTVPGLVTGVGFHAGASPGVACSGAPTASFASVGGIVTHC